MTDLVNISIKVENWIREFINKFPGGTSPFSNKSDLLKVSVGSGLAPAILTLKAVIQTNIWERIPENEKNTWISRIASFQDTSENKELTGFFIDSIFESVIESGSLLNRILNRKWNQPVYLWRMSLLRQCLSIFNYLGIADKIISPVFLKDKNKLSRWITGVLSLKDVWSGYSHLSGIFTIIKIFENTGRESALSSDYILKQINLESAVKSLKNKSPKMAVSGAMKLTTLAGIAKISLPYPEILIDAALSLEEAEHVCYFLNPIIVLDRASKNSSYRKNEISNFYEKRIKMLNNFSMPDGGFSTLTTGSLVNYAQIKATSNSKEGDIHAAHILAWAIKILADNTNQPLNWQEPPT